MALVVRKNASTLTDDEISEFVEAVLALKDNNSSGNTYNKYVEKHAETRFDFTRPYMNRHECPAFLPWHRIFLWEFEKDLQDASGNPNLALPYWDWGENEALSDPSTYRIWQDDFLGGDGSPVTTGPFRNGQWEIIRGNGNSDGPLVRNFGGMSTLPSSSRVNDAMSITPYDAAPWRDSLDLDFMTFRKFLEFALHNRGHGWVGGSMMDRTSPNDPVFFLHHCYVDKIWADWMAANPSADPYLPDDDMKWQGLNEEMYDTVYKATSFKTPSQVLKHADMGYIYDNEAQGCGNALNSIIRGMFGG